MCIFVIFRNHYFAAKRTRSSNDVEETKKNTNKKEAKSKKSKNDNEEVKRRKDGTLIFKDHPEFRPNLTPTQVISKGAFGGTYFRPIKSGVTKKNHHNIHRDTEISVLFEGIPESKLSSSEYKKSVNCYNCKAGQNLEQWEEKVKMALMTLMPYVFYTFNALPLLTQGMDQSQSSVWLVSLVLLLLYRSAM